MTLKHATIVVLICLGLSLLWALVGLVFPREALLGIYQSKLPSLLFISRDVALVLFFATLLKNQR